MTIRNHEVPVGISNAMFSYFKLNKLKLVDVLAELIDNSISGCLKIGQKPFIDITLNDDRIIIKDNGVGFCRNDFETALIAADDSTSKSSSSELNVYGYGLKGAAFWLGNVLTISTDSYKDNMHYELEFNIKTISKQINPTPTVLLNQTSIDQKNNPHSTQITITDVNSNNYQLRQNTIRDLRVMIGKIYAPRIQESELIIVLNNEIIQYDKRKYLVAHYYTCFEKIGHNKFKLKNDCQKKDQEIWKVDVDETITDESTGKSYSITGVLGLKPSQSSNDTGIRIYRKKRGILGCNSSAITDYNPFKLQEGKPAFLYMIGDIFLNDAFQKPLMGNDLPENNYLQELLDKVRQKHMRLFRQADEFRIAMLQPVMFDSIIHTTQKPSNESTYNFPQHESQRTADTIDKPKLELTVSKNNSPEKITYINPDSGLKFIFEESHNLTLFITLNEESNVLSVKCDQINFKSHRTIGRLLNELILAMGVDEFRNKINYLNSFN